MSRKITVDVDAGHSPALFRISEEISPGVGRELCAIEGVEAAAELARLLTFAVVAVDKRAAPEHARAAMAAYVSLEMINRLSPRIGTRVPGLPPRTKPKPQG